MTLTNIPSDLALTVQHALEEDIGTGDLTSQLLPQAKLSSAKVICRENAIMCGIPWFNEVYRQLDSGFHITWHVSDGDLLKKDTVICDLHGSARTMVTGERTALNLIQLLSATATVTNEYVQLIKGTNTQLLAKIIVWVYTMRY
jgi:nicotinate-nucleotide pyrophosphorylase (carboxylating)